MLLVTKSQNISGFTNWSQCHRGDVFLTETAVLTENDMGRWKVFKNIHDVHLWTGFYTISALKPD